MIKKRVISKEEIKARIEMKMEVLALKLLLAWEAGELSEGQVVEALERPRVEVRELRTLALSDAQVLFKNLTTKRGRDD